MLYNCTLTNDNQYICKGVTYKVAEVFLFGADPYLEYLLIIISSV